MVPKDPGRCMAATALTSQLFRKVKLSVPMLSRLRNWKAKSSQPSRSQLRILGLQGGWGLRVYIMMLGFCGRNLPGELLILLLAEA